MTWTYQGRLQPNWAPLGGAFCRFLENQISKFSHTRRVAIAQVVACAPVMRRPRVQSPVHAG